MCELLAVATPQPVPFTDVLPWAAEVERLGVGGFGWGVAWTGIDGVRRYRTPVCLADDAAGRDRLAGVRSDRFLVHLRRPSRLSTLDLADSQPFLDSADEDGAGTFAFCHNGYLERHAELRPTFGTRLGGRADSEVGFEWFRDRLVDGLEPAEALADVHRTFGGTANLGFVDAGEGTFAFCHNGTLKGDRTPYAGRLKGMADSEVGFCHLIDLLAEGEEPERALPRVHEDLGGKANFGYLGADGRLLVYEGNRPNPIWEFSLDGARVAATRLHSADESLFDLIFHDAEDRELVTGRVSEVGAAATQDVAGRELAS